MVEKSGHVSKWRGMVAKARHVSEWRVVVESGGAR